VGIVFYPLKRKTAGEKIRRPSYRTPVR